MATNSHIYLKLDDSDKNRFIKVDKELLHSFEEWNNNPPKIKIKENDVYLGIYCHWDGYINNGVGEELVKYYDTHEKVLNLMACGNCSKIVDSVIAYYAKIGEKKEKWNNCRPYSFDEPIFRGSYTYLFENGEWYVKTSSFNNSKWVLVKNFL